MTHLRSHSRAEARASFPLPRIHHYPLPFPVPQLLRADHRIPAELGQESQTSSCLRKGTPLASRVAQGVSGPSPSCVWNLRVFPDDARGCHAPSCCAFAHRAAFEEVSGHRVLIKSRPGNPGRLARGTTHVASLEFPRETGLILISTSVLGMMSDTLLGVVTKNLKEILGFLSLTHTLSSLWRNKRNIFPGGIEDTVKRMKTSAAGGGGTITG